jgi:hypothetical protein
VTEIQRYRVLDSFSGIEIREYEPHTLVTMQTSGNFNQAGSNAFGYLVSYISGRNQANQSIAMTAPVIQKPKAEGYAVSFVMPADMKAEQVPAPIGSSLVVEHESSKRIAAIRFSGMATRELFEGKGQKLLSTLNARGIRPIGDVFYARYNGPWTPPILRRNEALVEIAA